MALSALTWMWTHKRQLAMLSLITAGYAIKKTVPLAADELALLDALWAAAGFGALFTPNFSQVRK